MMNRLIKTSTIFLIVICFSACDYVSSPYKNQNSGSSGGVINAANTVKAADSTSLKNVLVEDYTGITCGNCPGAADILDTMIKKYGSRIVPMAVNAGSFATPPLAPSYYNIDFTSTTGDDYNTFFGISSNPNGMVNRKGYAQGTCVQTDGSWDGLANNSINNDTSFVKLKLSTQFDTVTRNISVTATSTFLSAISGNYNLVVLLTQDSIIAPQLKYGAPGNKITNYAHRYALRDAINSTWGDTLVANGATLNQTITKTYTYTIKSTYGNATSSSAPLACNVKQCYIVAYIYNRTSGSSKQYEVLQSLQLKIYK
jgi:hypothetical protein